MLSKYDADTVSEICVRKKNLWYYYQRPDSNPAPFELPTQIFFAAVVFILYIDVLLFFWKLLIPKPTKRFKVGGK